MFPCRDYFNPWSAQGKLFPKNLQTKLTRRSTRVWVGDAGITPHPGGVGEMVLYADSQADLTHRLLGLACSSS